MALIDCPSCNKKISDKAQSCQHCSFSLGTADAEDIARKQSLNKYLKNQKIQTQSMIAMLLFVAGFGSVHRFYWLFGRLARDENPRLWEWFADHAAWALAPAVIGIVVGYGCHLLPLFSDKTKGAVFLLGCGFSLWMLGVYIG